eukprot:SAG31_NODE_621_length_13502_cov_18.057002_4_plen_72_part_00
MGKRTASPHPVIPNLTLVAAAADAQTAAASAELAQVQAELVKGPATKDDDLSVKTKTRKCRELVLAGGTGH